MCLSCGIWTSVAGDDLSSSTRDGSVSPTSMTSSGATSLQQEDHEAGSVAISTSSDQSSMESSCKQLLGVIDKLAYHHSQVQPITWLSHGNFITSCDKLMIGYIVAWGIELLFFMSNSILCQTEHFSFMCSVCMKYMYITFANFFHHHVYYEINLGLSFYNLDYVMMVISTYTSSCFIPFVLC